jgi:hypothetical protein
VKVHNDYFARDTWHIGGYRDSHGGCRPYDFAALLD